MPNSDRSLFFSQRIDSFLVFSETLSIKETAARQGLSGSAVSRQLSSLEAGLGFSLIDRSSHPLSLTSDGKLFAAALREHYLQLHKALSGIQQKNFKLPALRCGFLETLTLPVADGFLAEVRKNVGQILCLSGNSDYLRRQLEEKRLDFIVVSRRYEHLQNMLSQPLLAEPLVLALPKEAAGQQQDWSWERLRFCGLPYIRFNRNSGGKEQDDLMRTVGLDFPDAIEADSTGLILALVGKGRGWSLVRPSALLSNEALLPGLALAPLPASPGPFIRHIYLIAEASFGEQHFREVSRLLCGIFQQGVLPRLFRISPWLSGRVFVGAGCEGEALR